MKVLDLATPEPAPHVVQAVMFDPWPFKERSVVVLNARTISERGVSDVWDERVLRDPGTGEVDYTWNVLCRLSDGTVGVATPAGLAAYLERPS